MLHPPPFLAFEPVVVKAFCFRGIPLLHDSQIPSLLIGETLQKLPPGQYLFCSLAIAKFFAEASNDIQLAIQLPFKSGTSDGYVLL
jgi:hypothetical protein